MDGASFKEHEKRRQCLCAILIRSDDRMVATAYDHQRMLLLVGVHSQLEWSAIAAAPSLTHDVTEKHFLCKCHFRPRGFKILRTSLPPSY